MLLDPAELRQSYDLGELNEDDVDPDPFKQFARWFDDAIKAELMEPNAMVLATANADGRPSARVVLMKGCDERGFTFFTNYASRKADEIAANPQASLLFWWDRLHRQVRIEGRLGKLPSAESDRYFASRPKGSQIGAVASPQSQRIESRQWLAERYAELEARYPDDIPRPAGWGGYLVKPQRFEFWQGRPSRLHDRLVYDADPTGGWTIGRLAP